MIPPIIPVSSIAGASPAAAAPSVASSQAGSGNFANVLGAAIDQLDSTTANASTLALEGATGQASVANVSVAASEAQLAVQLAAVVRNDGVAALNSIMSMSAG